MLLSISFLLSFVFNSRTIKIENVKYEYDDESGLLKSINIYADSAEGRKGMLKTWIQFDKDGEIKKINLTRNFETKTNKDKRSYVFYDNDFISFKNNSISYLSLGSIDKKQLEIRRVGDFLASYSYHKDKSCIYPFFEMKNPKSTYKFPKISKGYSTSLFTMDSINKLFLRDNR